PVPASAFRQISLTTRPAFYSFPGFAWERTAGEALPHVFSEPRFRQLVLTTAHTPRGECKTKPFICRRSLTLPDTVHPSWPSRDTLHAPRVYSPPLTRTTLTGLVGGKLSPPITRSIDLHVKAPSPTRLIIEMDDVSVPSDCTPDISTIHESPSRNQRPCPWPPPACEIDERICPLRGSRRIVCVPESLSRSFSVIL